MLYDCVSSTKDRRSMVRPHLPTNLMSSLREASRLTRTMRFWKNVCGIRGRKGGKGRRADMFLGHSRKRFRAPLVDMFLYSFARQQPRQCFSPIGSRTQNNGQCGPVLGSGESISPRKLASALSIGILDDFARDETSTTGLDEVLEVLRGIG